VKPSVPVTKFLYCGLDKRSNVFPDERVSFRKVLLALDRPQEIENIGKHQVEEPEFELDLAALLRKLPLERLDFVEGPPQLCRTNCQQPLNRSSAGEVDLPINVIDIRVQGTIQTNILSRVVKARHLKSAP
jgi:hypothetical protein